MTSLVPSVATPGRFPFLRLPDAMFSAKIATETCALPAIATAEAEAEVEAEADTADNQI